MVFSLRMSLQVKKALNKLFKLSSNDGHTITSQGFVYRFSPQETAE